MSLEKFDAEELESWREQPVTVAFVKELRTCRAGLLEHLASEGRAGSESAVRASAGRIAGLDDALRMIATKGVSDE